MRALLPLLLAAAAPGPTLELLDGSTVALDTFRGRVVVLDFWATWCAPCRAELMELDRVAAAHRGEVAAVAVLAERRPDARLLAAATASLHLPVARRLAAGGDRFPLPGNAVPAAYVLDRACRIAFVQVGPFPPGELERRLRPLLAAPVAGARPTQ